MDFRAYARRHGLAIDKLLMEFLASWRSEVQKNTPTLIPLTDMFIKANEGGGKIRGVLTVLGYQTACGKKIKEIYKVALANELFQTAILAQDDFMDKSPLRRGGPSLYVAMASWHKKRRMLGDSLHFGASQAINMSDVGFFLAVDVITKNKFAAEDKIRALSAFNKIIVYTGLGQMLDINLPAGRGEKTDEAVLELERHKTAEYTTVGPLTMGAYLAGAEESLIRNLTRFGIDLGIAFQIQDDLKGVFGQRREIGKTTRGDIEEGKMTLLYTHTMRNVTPAQKRGIEKFYGRGRITNAQARQIREIFRDTGAYEYAVKKSYEYIEKARRAIPALSKDPKIQNFYTGLCDYLLVFKA